MKKTILLTLISTLLSSTSFAQGGEVIDEGEEMWFLLLNRAKVSDHWTVGNELHIRRQDYFSEQKQLLIRPWVDYSPVQGFTASFGYSYIRTTPFGSDSTPVFNEHNIWEQVTLDHSPWSNVNFSHRLRLEHRRIFQEDGSGMSITNMNRFRYRLTSKIDLTEHWYFHLFDEIWLNVNEGVQISGFDRNWIYLGVGYHFSKDVALEIAYLDQWNAALDQYAHYRGLQFTFIYDFDFRNP